MTIRQVEISDADSVASLSGELGYPVTAQVMSDRIRYVQLLNNHAIYVACLEGKVAGWIDVGIAHHLQSGVYAEIGGLVVAVAARNNGIGKELVLAAEKWAAEQGVVEILVRSQVKREAAHRFYLRQGYVQIKTSAVFRKA